MVEEGTIPVPFEKFWERFPGISKVYLVETVDDLLPAQSHNELKLCATDLVNARSEKDWRADKPNLLLLVDPLLHCFVSGVTTTTTKELSKDATKCNFQMPCVKKESADLKYSDKFQLLPTEFLVDTTSKKVTIQSYINNLDPRGYKNVYNSIEAVVGAALPHFERVLCNLIGLGLEDDEVVSMNVPSFQMIVGMKSIFLTPGNSPKYLGSEWHIEGMKNERIVASAIYYYDIANITESRLSFRIQTNDAKNYTDLGYAPAQTNRLVVFPNIYEHAERSFELEDNSKFGYRKFITLFLVDPGVPIISTAQVAPQQESWYPITGQYSCNLLPVKGSKYLTSATMTLEKAKEYRRLAIAERRQVNTIVPDPEDPSPAKRQKTQDDHHTD